MTPPDIDPEVFKRQVEAALEEQRAGELSSLAKLREAQASFDVFLQHESRRLDAELGSDHPRARALQADLADSRARIGALNADLDVRRITVPSVAEEDALVHGRVRDADGTGVPGLTVCLVDRTGAAIAGTGSATTDRSGYFSIVLELARSDRRPAQQAYLAVFGSDGEELHREKQALALEAGARIQIEVTLGNPQVCEPSEPADPEGIAEVLDALEARESFSAIGASRDKLERWLAEAGVRTRGDLAEFVGKDEREVRDRLRLPNLEAAKAFRRLTKEVLERLG